MKKYVIMFALGLAMVGSANAQNAPQKVENGKEKNINRQERLNKKHKDGIGQNKDRRANKSPEQRANQRTEKMSQRYDLNSQQQQQLQALNLKQAQQRDAFRSEKRVTSANQDKQREEIKRFNASWEKDLKKILNKKQYAQYEQDRNQRQAQRPNLSGKDNDNNARSRRSNKG